MNIVIQMSENADMLQLFAAIQKIHPTNNISLQNEI